MADYYPLLAKALANLPTRAAPTARRAIYERARKALIGQLRSIRPPVPESDIAVEDAALDDAIARLEAEYGAQAAPTSAPPAARPAAAPPKPAPAPSPSTSPPRPVPTSAAPPPSPRPLATPAAAASVTPPPRAPIAAPTARRPTMGSLSAASSARVARAPEPTLAGEEASVGAAAPAVLDRAPPDETAQLPAIGASASPALLAPAARPDIVRPIAPGPADEATRRNPLLFIALGVLILIAGGVAAAAYFWREKPLEVVAKPQPVATDAANPPSQAKISDRVNPPGSPDAGASPVETPIPTVTVPVARVPAPTPTSPPVPAPTHAADSGAPAPTPAPGPAPMPAAAPAPLIPGASRAAILIGTASDPQKPLVNLGSAVWSIIPAAPGQPTSLAVRVEVDIPDQKMHATITIRKNADASLPATHTIDLRATFADGAEIKGLKDMGLPQLRKDDAPTGDPISGVRVKINDSYYLVGLTRSDADAAHNLELLSSRPWFDFPLLLNDDRIAKLTFTKGEAGDKALAQALDAWK